MKKEQIVAFIARFVGVGLSFLLSSLLARVLGAEDFGTYSFLIALIMLLTLPTQSALPIIALREMVKSKSINSKPILTRSIRMFIYLIVIYGFGITIITFLLNFIYVDFSIDNRLVYFSFPLLIFIPLSLLCGSICRGSGYLLVSMIPEYVVKPFFIFVFILCFYIFNSKVELHIAMLSTVLSSFLIVVFYWLFLRGKIASDNSSNNKPRFDFRQVVHLSVIAGGQIIFANVEVFFLGVLGTTEQVAIFKVALVISILIIFSQTVINQIIQPDIVKKYQSGDLGALQSLMKKSSLLITLLGVLVFVMILIFGKQFIVFFYGSEYESVYNILLILSFGQIVNMALGSVGTILNMTKNESYAVQPMLITIASNIILDVVLIYLYGVSGAAAAAVISMILWNVLLRHQVLKRTGLESSGLILLFKGN
ncbi:hypothetical protein BCU98_07185 [Vibrio splendidus]|uniref:oligosaccharide flippase family protein n=1 Tax=Vibrio splendidus TaxID=29497 RepID=UPI000C8332A5|nr:oligosaccharide flippase family protein [Vibrio splendidus]MBU2910346.1 oligosaccharide flippase family protein [Vibrio splendidus]MDO6531106.1 oligosaccharide flippase family protein [Vibrio splendidus]MDO6552040.1 oligosaccharide flippase family protein [Vibrio splendidus]PMG09904.1 hypothetical protein BCU98_07185 [Vibrio splendidus]